MCNFKSSLRSNFINETLLSCCHAHLRNLGWDKFNLGNPFIEKKRKSRSELESWNTLYVCWIHLNIFVRKFVGSSWWKRTETTTISFPGLRQTSLVAIFDLRVNDNMCFFSRLSMYHQRSHMKYSWCFRNPVKPSSCGNYLTFYSRHVRRPTGPDVIRCFIPRIPRPWPRLSLEQVLQNGPKVVPIPQNSKTRLKEKGLTYKTVTEQRRDRFTVLQSIHLCLHEKWITSKRFKWIKYIRLHQSDPC